jgi:8-oxo-dGTP pyrophosphatase MutT (NUDIX family)
MKACAVVLHPDGAPLRVLVFEHPRAGVQFVKGSVEAGEAPERAAMRELFEESGLESVSAMTLGTGEIDGALWHFVLCRARLPVRDVWQHFCADDGGHLFRFFWADPSTLDGLHPVFEQARDWIVAHI